jgi:hypothetical protein
MGAVAVAKASERTPADQGSKAWAGRVRKKAKELAREVETNYMRLAEVLYEIYAVPEDGNREKRAIYNVWGYSTFHGYVEEELGIQPKTADRLKRIWYLIEVKCQFSDEVKDRLIPLGRSKVRELIRVINEDNVEEWLEHAENCSYKELVRMIGKYLDDLEDARQQALDEGEDPEEATAEIQEPEEMLSETFQLWPAQARNVDQAIRRAKDVSGSVKKGHNLDLICTHFLGTNDFGKDKNKNQKRLLSDLEKSLRVRLVALDPDTMEILYGQKSLEDLANCEE